MKNKLPVVVVGLEQIKWMTVLVVRMIRAACAPLLQILGRVVLVTRVAVDELVVTLLDVSGQL